MLHRSKKRGIDDAARKLLATAAAGARQRIRDDRDQVEPRLQPLLAYLEENLFDRNLDVNTLKRQCGIRDNSVPVRFTSALGVTPHAYIEDRRMETACRLLADTDLFVWQIAELVGYSGIQVFSRAFGRWRGVRPIEYRKRSLARRAAARASRPQGPSETPAGEPRVAKLDPAPSEEELARLQATEIWNELRTRSPPEQEELVRNHLRLTSPALIVRLWAESRKAAPTDPAAGVRSAELALAAVDAIDPDHCGEKARRQLLARAWAALSNARRAAADLAGGEEAIRHAETLASGRRIDAATRAEVLATKALVRRDQGHPDEAQALIDQTLTLVRQTESSPVIATHLITKATIHQEGGEPALGVPLLEEAVARLQASDEPQLRSAAYRKLILCYVEAGQTRKAAATLEPARQHFLASGQESEAIRCRWLEGRLARDLDDPEAAEKAFLDARAAFVERKDGHHAALVCLDLADLYLRQKRAADLRRLVAELGPLIEAVQPEGEDLVALRNLCRAVASRQVTAALGEPGSTTRARDATS